MIGFSEWCFTSRTGARCLALFLGWGNPSSEHEWQLRDSFLEQNHHQSEIFQLLSRPRTFDRRSCPRLMRKKLAGYMAQGEEAKVFHSVTGNDLWIPIVKKIDESGLFCALRVNGPFTMLHCCCEICSLGLTTCLHRKRKLANLHLIPS